MEQISQMEQSSGKKSGAPKKRKCPGNVVTGKMSIAVACRRSLVLGQ